MQAHLTKDCAYHTSASRIFKEREPNLAERPKHGSLPTIYKAVHVQNQDQHQPTDLPIPRHSHMRATLRSARGASIALMCSPPSQDFSTYSLSETDLAPLDFTLISFLPTASLQSKSLKCHYCHQGSANKSSPTRETIY